MRRYILFLRYFSFRLSLCAATLVRQAADVWGGEHEWAVDSFVRHVRVCCVCVEGSRRLLRPEPRREATRVRPGQPTAGPGAVVQWRLAAAARTRCTASPGINCERGGVLLWHAACERLPGGWTRGRAPWMVRSGRQPLGLQVHGGPESGVWGQLMIPQRLICASVYW